MPKDASVPLPASLSDLRCVGIDAAVWRHASDGKPVPEEDDLDTTAMRVLVALVWHAYDGITEAAARHRISAAALKAYAVAGSGHDSYDGLRQALRLLASTELGGKDPARLLDIHLPAGFLLTSGMVEYSFTDRGRALFGLKEDGGRFVRAELAVIKALKSPFAIRLYLLLARYPDRRDSTLTATPSELWDLLGFPAGSVYRRQYAALKSRIIGPCLETIAKHASMTAEMIEHVAGTGRKVQALEFRMGRREREKPKAEKPAPKSKPTGLPGILADVDTFVAAMPEYIRHREASVRRNFDAFIAEVKAGRIKVDFSSDAHVISDLSDFIVDVESDALCQAEQARMSQWVDFDASDLDTD
ncbi:replication initiation protein [Magnetospirillum sp. SS-4]|uniref:replication initiation protein n=1 Tax=Magnetospirillum sp. SS-4 TaxID=2681465 RepID=UPI001573C8D5|nr:replication initiation protein [Magnetospirillum sp. SS-4]